jgi:hypothetical protein
METKDDFIFKTFRPFLPDDFRPTIQNKRLLERMVGPMIRVVNEDIWDQQPHLFAFNNKIFDLEKCQFVEPSPDQYIRTTCGWDYDDEYPLLERYATMSHIWDQWFPNPYNREKALDAFASTLVGKSPNVKRKIYFLDGSGGNGKSTCLSYMKALLGPHMFRRFNNPNEMLLVTRGINSKIEENKNYYSDDFIQTSLKKLERMGTADIFIETNNLKDVRSRDNEVPLFVEHITFETHFNDSIRRNTNVNSEETINMLRQALFMMLNNI